MTKSIRLTSKLFWGACLTLGLLILGLAPSLAAPSPQAPPPTVGALRYGRKYDVAQMAAIGQLDEGPELTAQGVNFVVHYKDAGGCTTTGLPDLMPTGTPSAWPSGAIQAFEHALSIWTMLLDADGTIEINACWLDAGPTGPLGTGQPASAFAGFPNAPLPGTLYPVALANELAGTDLNDTDGADHDGDGGGADVEIIIAFNSHSSIDWHFGTDANPPSGKKDFVTVAIHEIGHGLGFVSTMFVNTAGQDICNTGVAGDGQGCWGIEVGSERLPAIYDRFVENGTDQSLIATEVFTNPSVELGNELKSNAVFFDGPNAKAAKLYAPGSFVPGSSILHLDQSTYQSTPNRLMTPDYAGPQHHPGPIALGIFKDMGWDVFDLPLVTLTQSASASRVTAGQALTYTLTVTNTGYEVMTDVVITDTVPAHTTLNVGSLSGSNVITSGTTPGSVITWTTGVTLTTGKALSRTFAVTIAAELASVSAITNTAWVTSTAGVGAHATLDTTVVRNTYLPIILRKEN